MSELKLKNCPFCGSDAYFHKTRNGAILPLCIAGNCPASNDGAVLDNYKEAVEKWNTRPENPRIAELEAENESLRKQVKALTRNKGVF